MRYTLDMQQYTLQRWAEAFLHLVHDGTVIEDSHIGFSSQAMLCYTQDMHRYTLATRNDVIAKQMEETLA